ncbi:vWA domain-containing protein [Vibrio ishigakensis]|uniref:vWA domain-containing protein n=1 Tax=Vibrio ishigakensis TaxID=1481914 RepID=UPI0021C368CF|nr:VWA domain-containing protein [Vibrio ishigakensis]
MLDTMLWKQIFTQFHFIRPLWLMAFVPLAVVIYLRFKDDSEGGWQNQLPEHLKKALTIEDQGWRKQLPLKVLVVVTSLAILVCAGPTWQRAPSPFGEDKASLVVMLDANSSMLEKDVAPDRLARAKQKIRDLLSLRQGGKTALIAYAGSSHLAMPLTKDSQVFVPFLNAIEPGVMPVEGKRPESAIQLLDEQLSGSEASTVLLVTDGMPPSSLEAMSEYFASGSNQLLILAMGNPEFNANSPLDLNSLQQLASEVSGRVQLVTIDNQDINQINTWVERHMQINGDTVMPWQDMGYIVLFPIAVLLLLWFRKGWLVQWCLVGAVLVGSVMPQQVMAQPVKSVAEEAPLEQVSNWDRAWQSWLDIWFTRDQQGQYLFDNQQYLEAAKRYQDPMHRGIAYYYAGEYKLAHAQFVNIDSPLALFNAANSLARQREYIKARNLYQLLLEQELDQTLQERTENNLKVLQGIIDEVNRLSESQKGTTDGAEDSVELPDDKPQTGDGAEEDVVQEMLQKETLNAREILGSEELAAKWLKRVEADPKLFLRAKFQLQYRQSQYQAEEGK